MPTKLLVQPRVSRLQTALIKLWIILFGGEVIRTLTGHYDWVNSVAINPDGKAFASGSSDRTIRIWNLATGEQIYTGIMKQRSHSFDMIAVFQYIFS
ncbi:MAG: hypothetical protein V7K90_07050 [Nostoc sp.]|uniref:WD40 repeat domain-containing protein n=1 Tax=Nostoc sp. TaxID=1180 RepID=UPI002FFB17BB